MAVVDESSVIDEAYEFSAPRFFDFISGESEEDTRKAELWFDTALSYAPSPFMPRIKTGRSVQLESLCNFSEAEQSDKAPTSSETTASNITKAIALGPEKDQTWPQSQMMPTEITEDVTPNDTKEEVSANPDNLVPADEKKTCNTKEEVSTNLDNLVPADEKKTGDTNDVACAQTNGSTTMGVASCTMKVEPPTKDNSSTPQQICTPKSTTVSRKGNLLQTDTKKHQTAKKIASMVKNPSALKSQNRSQLLQAKDSKPASARREAKLKTTIATPNFAQENQPIKRQKLEGGRSRQILNLKTQTLPHKSRPGSSSNLYSSTAKTCKEDRKVYVREPAVPFVSMAEMMRRFQSNTRDMSLPRMSSSLSHADATSIAQRKTKLTLTRPKEPQFETAQRVRSVRVKSSAELEEEMMAKIPKFKARPLNKKMMEAPSLPAPPRSTPHLPEFQEFHLETMARANQNAETSTIASTECASENHQWKPHLTAPRSPLLQTSLRARPPRIKSSEELEREELEKVPKFKARPLNKKIFESKGDLGMFCNTKQHVTVPQEFHFAIDERIPPPTTIADLFDKISLNSEPYNNKQMPKNTAPHPFHLHTEERGADKERKFVMELMQKQLEEERARIPKANPYPYTTDYPVIPPKPEPKHCTKPEPFQLESLTRHEEEMQREMEERRRKDMQEAQMRIFKAQPILKEDPLPVPEKVRKPLTEVQEFNLQVDHRAVDRAEFDKKIKEKEMMYKRYRDEAESAKMIEEEKALKQLRRTLVPHARPLPKFDHPFLPQKSSKEVTKPKSPKLRVNRRERRKYVSAVAAASSAAASHMR